jgi:hypothetical protein
MEEADSVAAGEEDSAVAVADSAAVGEADFAAAVALVSAAAGEADSAAAVLVSAEAASVAVIAACQRHVAAEGMPDRAHLAVTGLTRTPDPGACGPASRTAQADPSVRQGHRVPLSLTAVGTLLRSAAVARERPLRLPRFDQELMEAGGNRSAEVVGLLLRARQQGAPLRQTRWQGGTPYPSQPLFRRSIAHSGIRTSAVFAPDFAPGLAPELAPDLALD